MASILPKLRPKTRKRNGLTSEVGCKLIQHCWNDYKARQVPSESRWQCVGGMRPIISPQ